MKLNVFENFFSHIVYRQFIIVRSYIQMGIKCMYLYLQMNYADNRPSTCVQCTYADVRIFSFILLCDWHTNMGSRHKHNSTCTCLQTQHWWPIVWHLFKKYIFSEHKVILVDVCGTSTTTMTAHYICVCIIVSAPYVYLRYAPRCIRAIGGHLIFKWKWIARLWYEHVVECVF